MDRFSILKDIPVPEEESLPIKKESEESAVKTKKESNAPREESLFQQPIVRTDEEIPTREIQNANLERISNNVHCPICGYEGDQSMNINISFNDNGNSVLNGIFCMRCYARWINENIPRVFRE